jgi:hypothetical protein
MKKLFMLFLIVLAALACMGALCDMSSHNGPQNNNYIDTTNITYLDVPVNVSISVLVREYDSSIQKLIPSIGASVHFDSTTTIVSTDSSGYANGFFQAKTMPFKYGYEVNKKGFNKLIYQNWEKNLIIVDKTTIYKTK